MNKYSKRENNRYDPHGEGLFNISRSAIEMFVECPRCFYLDKRLGLGRPSMPSRALNSAVDQLLKSEFDILRKNGERHALMKKYKIDAVPFNDSRLPDWQNNFIGASVIHTPTNFKITGAIDDIWLNNRTKELHIVDYKAISINGEVSLDGEYKDSYKRQVEIYQWIFRQMGFKVSNIAYFVFANALKNLPKFDGKLEFKSTILSYKGDDSWVEPTIFKIKECLDSETIPPSNENCEYCAYRHFIAQELDENYDKPSVTLEENEMVLLTVILRASLTHFSNLPIQNWEKEMWDYYHMLQNIQVKLEKLVEEYKNSKNK